MATKRSEENELHFPVASDETSIYESINKYEFCEFYYLHLYGFVDNVLPFAVHVFFNTFFF